MTVACQSVSITNQPANSRIFPAVLFGFYQVNEKTSENDKLMRTHARIIVMSGKNHESESHAA